MVNRSNIGIMIDTTPFPSFKGQARRTRCSTQELVPLCSYLRWAGRDSNDKGRPNPYRQRCPIIYREGAIDIASIVNRMPKMVYSIELPHIERAKEFGYAEHARRCIVCKGLFLPNIQGMKSKRHSESNRKSQAKYEFTYVIDTKRIFGHKI